MQKNISLCEGDTNKALFNAKKMDTDSSVDFSADLKNTVLAWMHSYGIRLKEKDELIDLLIKYFTFREKYIEPRKRKVYVSKEIVEKKSTLPKLTCDAFDKIKTWIQQGVDINCFQGRGLYGGGNRDYQNMLYGVVHLHLSARKDDILPIKKKNGFAKPGEYLLFALFNDNSAFFLDVMPHPKTLSPQNSNAEEWTSSRYVKIIESNWPKLLESAKIPLDSLCDEYGNPIKLSDKDIAELTVNGITTLIEGNHGIYMMGLGVSSYGDSTKAVMSAQKLINSAVLYQMKYTENKIAIHNLFSEMLCNAGKVVPDKFDVHYEYIPDLRKWVILDQISGAALDLTTGTVYLFM